MKSAALPFALLFVIQLLDCTSATKGDDGDDFQALPDLMPPADEYLSFNYYHNTCPDFESIVFNTIQKWVKDDYTIAASLLRLHFHDCSVRVCDS